MCFPERGHSPRPKGGHLGEDLKVVTEPAVNFYSVPGQTIDGQVSATNANGCQAPNKPEFRTQKLQ